MTVSLFAHAWILSKHILFKSSNIGYSNIISKNVMQLPMLFIPSRTTMILRRRYPVPLYKEGNVPRIRKCNEFYDLVEDTDIQPESLMDLVLTSYVPGVGNAGDIISIKRSAGYYKLLLPGLAGYPTPENLQYSKDLKKDMTVQEKQVSPSVESCMKYLKRRCVLIFMNKEKEWTVEPWHIRASFRRAGVHILSNDSIEMPSHPIKGPNMDIEGKDFYVTIRINKKHKVKVQCRIHHWSTVPSDRLPIEENFWMITGEKIFPDEDKKR